MTAWMTLAAQLTGGVVLLLATVGGVTRAGPYAPELVTCDDLPTAKLCLSEGLMQSDFMDIDAMAPTMSSHLAER